MRGFYNLHGSHQFCCHDTVYPSIITIDAQCVTHVVLKVTQYNVVKPKTVFLLLVWNRKEISTFSLKPGGIKPNTNAVQRYTEILDLVNSFQANYIGKPCRWQVLVLCCCIGIDNSGIIRVHLSLSFHLFRSGCL